jgi:nicotinamide phosphoribosyltransferase
MKNFLLNTDSYKASHWLQYPPNTENVFSYVESRGGKYPVTVFFGLQAFIKEYLTTPITAADINEAEAVWKLHGEPFNREGWEYILNKHEGYLPLIIRAVPEGSVIPTNNVLVTVEATDEKCFWLTSFVETALLRAVWYPTTVATQSWTIKQSIRNYLHETGDPSSVDFKLHDFGARGVSSFESAGLGGMAHLVNFKGTDTITGALYAIKYYDAGEMPAFSIPAAEHSTITAFGRENEVEAYRNMLQQFAKPGSLVAVVSDSYDIYNACENLWGEQLRQQVIDSGATIVIRPDSGDPATVVLDVVRILDNKFGSVVNEKGYRVLNNVRVIQGDGINELSIRSILMNLQFAGYSADNVAFGMGGALLQVLNRDTQKFAMKASAIKINGQWKEIYKDPKTDSGKRSKKGRVTLFKRDGKYFSGVEAHGALDELITVFYNGQLIERQTFDQIRQRADKGMYEPKDQ